MVSLSLPNGLLNDGVYRTLDGVPVDQLDNPIGISKIDVSDGLGISTADIISATATGHYGSRNWADGATFIDPFSGNEYGPGDKCSIFVGYVWESAGASPGRPNFGAFQAPFEVGSPPTAGQWADPSYKIPGWRVLRGNEAPRSGDVVAQSIGYSDASGHVGIVGPRIDGRLTFVGTGSQGPTYSDGRWNSQGTYGPHGTIEVIPMPSTLTGGANVQHGPLVYRRWTGR